MKSQLNRILILWSLVYASRCAFSQQELIKNPSATDKYHAERARLLGENTAKLSVSIQLDRNVYLPGERAEITISAINNTGAPREAFAPFTTSTGVIELYRHKVVDGKTTWEADDEDILCCLHGRSDDRPTYTFAAGESIQKRLGSDDKNFDQEGPLFRVPRQPGKYMITYNYVGSRPGLNRLEFDVVSARILQMERAIFSKAHEYLSQSKERLQVPREASRYPGIVWKLPRDSRARCSILQRFGGCSSFEGFLHRCRLHDPVHKVGLEPNADHWVETTV